MKLPAYICAFALPFSLAQASLIEVTVTAPGPVGLAPAYAVFHTGSFDFFDAGAPASAALEALAELGDTSGFSAPNGMTLAPGGPFVPGGGTDSFVFDVDPSESFFNVAAMILPSNDWFVGDDASLDVSGLLAAPVGTMLTLHFTTIWNAGTELEDFAFAPGGGLVGITTPSSPPGGSPEGGVVGPVIGADPFGVFASLEPPGYDTTAIDPMGGPIASVTLTVVPEPSTAVLLGLGMIGVIAASRRNVA